MRLKHSQFAAKLSVAILAGLCVTNGCRKSGGKDSNNSNNNGNPGQNGDGIQVGVSAGSLMVRSDATALSLLGDMVLQEGAALTPSIPNLANGEYPGMGINYGESVVDGFKIRVVGVGMGTGIAGSSNGRSMSLFDWSSAPKELEISGGLNTSVTDSKSIVVNADVYTYASLQIQRNFDIKAYAYMDTDADGTIETTIYTKPSGVVKVPQIISHQDLLNDSSLGYGYFHYDFIYEGPKQDSNPNEWFSSQFVTPISVCESPKTPPPAQQTNGSPTATLFATQLMGDCTEVTKLQVDILIDTTRVVKAWDGRYGSPTPPSVPNPGMPFPYAPQTTNGMTYGFPAGQPAFGLVYLPAFAFVGTGTGSASGVSSETYMLSEFAPTDPSFKVAETYRFSVVYDSSGKPFVGKAQSNSPDIPLYVGMTARAFEPDPNTADTFSFYTGSNGVAPGADPSTQDGGLDYHNDKSKAGHRFDGFKSIAKVGDTIQLKQYDAERCDARSVEKKMHEDMNNPLSCSTSDAAKCAADPLYAYQAYNFCVTFRKQFDTPLAADFGLDASGKTYRKVFMTRVK